MLYSELYDLTKGECTQEEYDAVNAVYMSLEDMTKQQAAALWRKLYARKRREAAKAKLEKQHSVEYLCTLYPGHTEVIKGKGVLVVERDNEGDYDRHNRRTVWLYNDMLAKDLTTTFLGWVTDYSYQIAAGNPGKITRRGEIITA